MKFFIPIFALFIIASCKTSNVIQYEYKSTTQLGAQTTIVTADSLITQFNGRIGSKREARAITAQEWKAIGSSISEVDLKTLAEMKSPSDKRATDAAPYGSVKLITKDSTYASQSFDGYHSPEALLPLMGMIQKLRGEK